MTLTPDSRLPRVPQDGIFLLLFKTIFRSLVIFTKMTLTPNAGHPRVFTRVLGNVFFTINNLQTKTLNFNFINTAVKGFLSQCL